ncbi:uncharacterized protein [Apostichopus japonicus]|uniref:uncharacterized protein n=1 Tax=Stichopus japonicus TaxID=307972 RepID=UPI003AB22D75
MQMSTAVSDFILAFVSYAVTVSLFRIPRVAAAFGFLLTAVAASLGSLKFGLQQPTVTIIRYHSHASWLAAVVGTSLFTADYHLGNRYQSGYFSSLSILLLCAIPVVTIAKVSNFWSSQVDAYITDAMGFVSILSLLLSSVMYPNSSCLVGSLMYVLAGVVGTQGNLYNIKRVDWFHYFLAFGNVAFFLAFKHKPNPVYFKSG